jgi:hypothetical protein
MTWRNVLPLSLELCLPSASFWLLAWLTLWTWRWRQYVSPKYLRTSTRLHDITSQMGYVPRNTDTILHFRNVFPSLNICHKKCTEKQTVSSVFSNWIKLRFSYRNETWTRTYTKDCISFMLTSLNSMWYSNTQSTERHWSRSAEYNKAKVQWMPYAHFLGMANHCFLKTANFIYRWRMGKNSLDPFVGVPRETDDFCFLAIVIFLIQKLRNMIWRITRFLDCVHRLVTENTVSETNPDSKM